MADVQKPSDKGALHLGELVDCPKCGRSNPAGTRYCEGCGASLKDAQPTKAAEPPKKKGLFGKVRK